jgi:hypothetical protein
MSLSEETSFFVLFSYTSLHEKEQQQLREEVLLANVSFVTFTYMLNTLIRNSNIHVRTNKQMEGVAVDGKESSKKKKTKTHTWIHTCFSNPLFWYPRNVSCLCVTGIL